MSAAPGRRSSGALVLPSRDATGAPFLAPDEDEVTLAFGALERWEFLTVRSPLERVHLFGAALAPLEALLPAAFGLPKLPVTVHPDSRESAEGILRTERMAEGAAVLVAARCVPEEGAGRAAGVALGFDRLPVPPPPGDRTQPADAALRAIPSSLASGADAVAGLLAELPRTGARVVAEGAPGRPRPGPSPPAILAQVSEGAYLPRPSYLEDLPARWRFAAARCSACGSVTFPARGRCRACGRTGTLEGVTLPRWDLEVEAVTTVHPGAQPSEFDWRMDSMGAYDVALVGLAPGVRATLQGADLPGGSFRTGDRVDSALRRLYPMEGEWRYGRKMVPRALTTAGTSG